MDTVALVLAVAGVALAGLVYGVLAMRAINAPSTATSSSSR